LPLSGQGNLNNNDHRHQAGLFLRDQYAQKLAEEIQLKA